MGQHALFSVQGTVLGPLIFITENTSSQLRLFADDCLLYRVIKAEQDSFLLQKDLDVLSHWAVIWQMRFNPSKCAFMRCTIPLIPAIYYVDPFYLLYTSIYI